MQVVDDGYCFICGKNNPSGLKASFKLDPVNRRAETQVTIPREFQGWQGIVHGGIISALLDEICAQACICSGIDVVTSEIRIRYRKPVPTGSTVRAVGEIISENSRIVEVKGILEMDGCLMAESSVKMFRTRA